MPRDHRDELSKAIEKENEVRKEITDNRKLAEEQREQDLQRIHQAIENNILPGAAAFKEWLGQLGRKVEVFNPRYDNGYGVTVRVFRPDLNGDDQELLEATLKLTLEDDSILYEWSGKQGGQGGTTWKDMRPQRGYQNLTRDQVIEKLTDLCLTAPKLGG
jgi:hypothetical protein